MKIYESGDRGLIPPPWPRPTMLWLKETPGFHRWTNRGFLFDITRATVDHINELPGVDWSDIDLSDIEDIVKAESGNLGEINLNFKTEPFSHQIEALKLSNGKKAFGYFMEVGTGKTKTLCDDLAIAHFVHGVERALITAKDFGNAEQWLNEQLPLHFPGKYAAIIIPPPSARTKKFLGQWDNFKNQSCLKIAISAVSSFTPKKPDTLIHDFMITDPDRNYWAIDESSKIKNFGAQRTKNILKLSWKYAKWRRIMTGSPITRGVENLYPQLTFLDPNILGFNSFYTFRNYFCVLEKIYGAKSPHAKRIVSYKNMDILEKRIGSHTFRVLKKDCFDLPEQVYERVEVEWTPEQRKLYSTLEEELFLELDAGTVEAPLAIVKMQKLQQIACGFVVSDNGIVEIKNKRIEALIDILDGVEGRAIVWATYTHSIKAIKAALEAQGDAVFEYHGRMSRKEKADALEGFRNAERGRLISNPASGGTGLNLQFCSTAIYFSNDFDAESRWQSEGRIHRAGQTESCTYIDIVIKDSIDELPLLSHEAKGKLATGILDAAMEWRKRRVDESTKKESGLA